MNYLTTHPCLLGKRSLNREEMNQKMMIRNINRKLILEKLIEKHGYKCAYCGIEMFGNIYLDHFYPITKYPEKIADEDNYVLSCASCNAIKRDISPINEDGKTIILFPYSENYKNEIQVEGTGEAIGLTESAKSTIHILRLNRPILKEYRMSHIDEYLEEINDGEPPIDAYKESIKEIKVLSTVASGCTGTTQSYFNKMVFGNLISVMELYLQKVAVKLVKENEEYYWKFVEGYKWEGEKKYKISEVKQLLDELSLKVNEQLVTILYHNIPLVENIFKFFDIELFENDVDKEYFIKVINIRHDIVHRNGRCKNEAEKYHIISNEMIQELIDKLDNLVENIEKQLSDS